MTDQTTEDFVLRVPRVEGRTRDDLYRQIVLFLDAAYAADITGDPTKARWPRHSWGTPIDYILVKDQTP